MPTYYPTGSHAPSTTTITPTYTPTATGSPSPLMDGPTTEAPTYAPITYRPTLFPTSSIREPKVPTRSPAPTIASAPPSQQPSKAQACESPVLTPKLRQSCCAGRHLRHPRRPMEVLCASRVRKVGEALWVLFCTWAVMAKCYDAHTNDDDNNGGSGRDGRGEGWG